MILADYVAGISASVILLTGYVTGILTIIKGARLKASLMVWSGLFLVLMGQFYLGTVMSFIRLLIMGSNLYPDFPYLSARLAYTGSPIAATIAMYIGFSMIKPEWRYNMTVFYGASSIFYWLGMYIPRYADINLDEMLPLRDIGIGLVDISLQGWVLILTALYLVSMLAFNTSGLLILARKSSGVIKKKAIVQSIGYFIFVIIGAVDSLFELAEWIFIPRIIMVIGYILLAYGYQVTK